jgi:MATE family multidrug resistance protein
VVSLLLSVHLHRLTKLSVPLLIQNLLGFSTTVIAVAFVGNLDRPDLLSSAVLANSLFNVTGFSIMQGLASGMESLCAQVRCDPVPR